MIERPAGGGSAHSRRAGSAGFTLLEVLVALSVLAITLAVLLPVFSGVASRNNATDEERTAIALARSKLDALGNESPVTDGVTEGAFDNGFGWRLEVAPYRADGSDPRIDMKLAVLTVRWPKPNGPHEFAMHAIRFTERP